MNSTIFKLVSILYDVRVRIDGVGSKDNVVREVTCSSANQSQLRKMVVEGPEFLKFC